MEEYRRDVVWSLDKSRKSRDRAQVDEQIDSKGKGMVLGVRIRKEADE